MHLPNNNLKNNILPSKLLKSQWIKYNYVNYYQLYLLHLNGNKKTLFRISGAN